MEISAEQLVKVYRGRKVVDNVSVEMRQGEIVGLLGPNGAGKTTTFYMIVGLVRPNGGRVLLDGVDITHMPMYRRARAGIGYLPQEPSVFRELSVIDNVRLVLEHTKLSRKEQAAKADKLLADMHIDHLRGNRARTLSGGERRRVEIARALATDPAFILLDEPFTGVDPIAIQDIQSIVAHLKERNIGILITDHNVQATLKITERAYIIADGQIKASGISDKLPDDPVARKYYFGEGFGELSIHMRLVDRLILRELIGPFLNSLFMFLGVLFGTAQLFTMTEYLVKGVSMMSVLKMSLYSMPDLVTMSLPMSMLLASLLAFGRMSGDSEHVALFAGGISFTRIVRPVAWMGLLVSILTFAWNETVVPPAMRAFTALKQEAIKQVDPSQQLRYTKMRDDGSVDRIVIVQSYDAKRDRLIGVTVFKMSEDPKRAGQPEAALYAEWAVAKDPQGSDWEFHRVSTKSLTPEQDARYIVDSFMETATVATLPARNMGLDRDMKSILESSSDNRLLTFGQLKAKIARLHQEHELNTGDMEVDLWGKLTYPIACLIFGALGAPLGVRPHRGGKAIGFGIAISIIFLYWVLYRWMYVLGKNGQLVPLVAAFTPCLIGLVCAVILVSRTRQ